jgi:hypothetical protein
MFGWARTLSTIVVCAFAVPVAAQTPAPPTTAIDGTYGGVSAVATRSRPGSEEILCRPEEAPSPLTIRNGVIQPTGGDGWQGSVNSQGALVMQDLRARWVEAQIDPSGTITGEYPGPTCKTTFVWRKQPG